MDCEIMLVLFVSHVVGGGDIRQRHKWWCGVYVEGTDVGGIWAYGRWTITKVKNNHDTRPNIQQPSRTTSPGQINRSVLSRTAV